MTYISLIVLYVLQEYLNVEMQYISNASKYLLYGTFEIRKKISQNKFSEIFQQYFQIQ